MLYLVDSIFVSNLESHFEKIKKTKIGIAPNFAPWKKIGKKANNIVEIYHKKHSFRTRVMKLLEFMVF